MDSPGPLPELKPTAMAPAFPRKLSTALDMILMIWMYSYRTCAMHGISPVVDPGFPRSRGANRKGGGTNLFRCQMFPKTEKILN